MNFRWVAAVAVLAALAVVALMLWPASPTTADPPAGAPPPEPSSAPRPSAATTRREEPAGSARATVAPDSAPQPVLLAPNRIPGQDQASPSSVPAEASSNGADAGRIRYPIDRDGLRAAVRADLHQIKECYEQWLKVQPGLGGKLKVRFTIDTDDGVEGRVSAISLGDAGLGHLAMEGCVLQVFEQLRFEPPLDGTIDVTYPIVLLADGG